MNYPLQLSFKVLAIAPQLWLRDASGQTICYLKQKLFKLKEDVNVFADEAQTHLLYNIKADRIIDWSARYHFTLADGKPLGSVGRKGMRSLWRAHYEIHALNDLYATSEQAPESAIREEKPFIKVLDGLFSEIPLIGSFLFHPSYIVSRISDGTPLLRIKKKSALWEGKFEITKLGEMAPDEETRALLSLLMLVLLERRRG